MQFHQVPMMEIIQLSTQLLYPSKQISKVTSVNAIGEGIGKASAPKPGRNVAELFNTRN